MKLGELYMSEFSGDDIQPENLAEELGISDFRFPDEYYQRAEVVTQELVAKIIPHLKSLTQEEIGDYLLAHREELFAIFDTFPDMYRFPILVTKTNLISHGILSAQLLGMDPTEFYGAFLKCMHFYLYLRSIRGLSKLYRRNPKIPPVLPIIYNVAQQECLNELECAWGSRSHYFFSKMLPGEKGVAITQEILQGNPYVIPPEYRAQYKNRKVDFWRQEGLPPERILLNIGQHIEDKISTQDRAKFAQLDSQALDFFLCQNHILGYEEIISKIFKNPDHIPAWGVWISRNTHLLKKSNSETLKVFRGVFGLKDTDVFGKDIGQLTREAKKKIPQPLQDALLKGDQELRARMKEVRKKFEKPAQTVAQFPDPPVGSTAMASLVTRPASPAKEVIPAPKIDTIFADYEAAKKSKRQLTKIDFSGYRFPEGTKIIFVRSLPGRKTNFQTIELTNPAGTSEIPPVLGKSIKGHFYYRITIILPQSHKFDGENVFEVSVYAHVESTEEEMGDEKKQMEEGGNQPTTTPEPVKTIVEEVTEKVEHTLAPISTSFIALSFILEEKEKEYSMNNISEDGSITLCISAQDAEEVLGKKDAVSLVDAHRKWTIRADNTIEPTIEDENVEKQLFSIVRQIRDTADEKKRKEELQQAQEAEQREYEQVRMKFAPILEFARGFQFEGKQNGHFDDQKRVLIEELRSLGWSLPVAFSGTQVIWRHIGAKVRILYTSKQCISFAINGEQLELTGAQKKCYEEVAQAFAHIARFFNVEAKERTRMVNREKAIQKETETGAVAYDKLLQEGRARLVLFGPYQGGHGVWSSKFPTEKTPHMLDERASYGNVEAILEQYPHAELCYRRDLLCINGELASDASQESIENASLNITELRQSPRARYILRKRILITLKFEKFSEETDRAPIKHEKNKKEGGVSALDILLRTQKERSIQSASDVTEDFLSYYIDALERNKIRVHYVWPLSARLDEHRTRMRKHAAKIASSQTETTVD